LVDAVQEVLARSEQADGGDGSAQHFEVLRHEAPPEVLAEGQQEDGDGDHDEIALDTEGLAERGSTGHRGRRGPMVTARLWSQNGSGPLKTF
jgi:hypothetical protein